MMTPTREEQKGTVQATVPADVYDEIIEMAQSTQRQWLPADLCDLYQEYAELQQSKLQWPVWLALSGLCAVLIDYSGDGEVLARWLAENFTSEIMVPPYTVEEVLRAALDCYLDWRTPIVGYAILEQRLTKVA